MISKHPTNKLKDKILSSFCIKTWRFWEILGVHLTPNHFYFPIPDTRNLSKYDFNKKFSLDGIYLCDSDMLALLKKITLYKNEYFKLHMDSGYASNGDGAILYGMVRELKPKRIVEIGSGFSTRIAQAALRKNDSKNKQEHEIIAIEPFPKPFLKKLADNTNNVKLIQDKVELAKTKICEVLQEGDILFIDSSHVINIGNDVHHLYLSVLPKVPVGTIIHIHDIRFPYDYPKKWVLKEKRFWTEQYLLQMFLAFNDSYEILFAGNYMYDKYPELMADSLVGLDVGGTGWPGCFWLRRKK